MIINEVLNNWNESKKEVGDEIYWKNILNIVKNSKYKPIGVGNKTIIKE